MVKISIIIPVYNVEKYLDKCIESCVNQTLDEVEVIIINDASLDNSDIIMKKYAEKYPNKVVNIFLTKNIKQGGARNKGINIARGKYLCFVDGDDFIDKTMCEKLYWKCERENLDIACCNGYFVYEDKQVYWEQIKKYDLQPNGSLQHFTGQCYMIIKRDIIVNNNLFYPADIFHEDTSVVPLWYLCANKIELYQEPLYYQNIHRDSTSASIDISSTFQVIKAVGILVENAKRINCYFKNKDKIDCFVFTRISFAAQNLLRMKSKVTDKEKLQFETELEKWKSFGFEQDLIINYLSQEEYRLTRLFIDDFETYIKLDWEKCNQKIVQYGYFEKREQLSLLINEINKDKRKIIIWGAGKRGRMIISTMHDMGIDYIVGDNNQKLWETSLETGDFIHNPEWIKQNVQNPIFLISSTRFYHDIVQSLKKLYGNVLTIDVLAYLEYNMSIEEIGYMVQKGESV